MTTRDLEFDKIIQSKLIKGYIETDKSKALAKKPKVKVAKKKVTKKRPKTSLSARIARIKI